jgi:glycosyl transferase family 25
MQFYVLNIKRAKSRRVFMENQAREKGFTFKFIEGFDYRDMTASEMHTLCVPGTDSETAMIKGVRAASLSHLEMYKAFLDQGDQYGVFMEDDIVLDKNITSVLNYIKHQDFSDSPILLRYYCHKPHGLSLSNIEKIELDIGMSPNPELLKPVNLNHCASAAAYILHRDVAQRMVNLLYPSGHVPDDWDLFFRKGCFKSLYCLYPQMTTDASFPPIVEYADTKKLSAKIKSSVRHFIPLPIVNLLRGKKKNVRHGLTVDDLPVKWPKQDVIF